MVFKVKGKVGLRGVYEEDAIFLLVLVAGEKGGVDSAAYSRHVDLGT